MRNDARSLLRHRAFTLAAVALAAAVTSVALEFVRIRLPCSFALFAVAGSLALWACHGVSRQYKTLRASSLERPVSQPEHCFSLVGNLRWQARRLSPASPTPREDHKGSFSDRSSLDAKSAFGNTALSRAGRLFSQIHSESRLTASGPESPRTCECCRYERTDQCSGRFDGFE